MYPLVKQAPRPHRVTLRYFAALINHCLSIKSLPLSQNIHAQLIKFGFSGNTFLGNRCLELYFKLGVPTDAVKVFDDIAEKNTITWNVCLKGLLQAWKFSHAQYVFDEMPERDVVSWNTMISGSASCGFSDYALRLFSDMTKMGVRPSEFTLSILASLVLCEGHGREIHGTVIRRGLTLSNVIICNSLIDMYGKLGLVDYAFGVFMAMEDLDVISWNSLISCFSKSGLGGLALAQFGLMRSMGYDPNEYTVSVVMSVCADLRNLEKGKQIFALCIKTGFVSNTIVSSAIIDMFSKCNRFDDSVRLFEEFDRVDCPLCDCVIGCYASHGLFEESLKLFVLSLNADLKPNEFTISTVLSTISALMLDSGTQVHGLSIKLGLESDPIVASSMVEMYNKMGLVDSAMKILETTNTRDLILWNNMIVGLAQNGRTAESLCLFQDLLERGPPPDRITFSSVLMACCYGGFVDEGIAIFSSMENKYGIRVDHGHYACMVDLLCRVGMFEEALNIIKTMPFEPNSFVWEPMLRSPAINSDLRLAEAVAEKIAALDPHLIHPYLVLAKIYELNEQWEDLVRIRYAMSRSRSKHVQVCSWTAIRNHVYTFASGQLQQHKDEDVLSTLKLLSWEMESEGQM